MINTTNGELVFNQSGRALDESVRKALRTAAGWVQKAYHLEHINLEDVTTKTHVRIAFAAYSKLCILSEPGIVFDEQYVRDAFNFFNLPYEGVSEEHFYKVTFAKPGSAWAYKRTYGRHVRRGFGAFMIALHARGAITLPYLFGWPELQGTELCDVDSLPELLRFIRSMGSPIDTNNETVFEYLPANQRERLIWAGTKLILATGWLSPTDANYEDLLLIKAENEATQFSGRGHVDLGIGLLIKALENKYKRDCGLSVAGWRRHLKNTAYSQRTSGPVGKKLRAKLDFTRSDNASLLLKAGEMSPGDMYPERLAQIGGLPDLQVDLPTLSKTWLALERAYLKRRRESDKQVLICLGYLNIYLFVYLPHWYARHPSCSIAFPSEPAKLIGGIFIANLGLADELEKPNTVVEFFEHLAATKEWVPNSHYGILKQIEIFFDFLEQHSEQLPGCNGFRQPLHADDFPPVTRAGGSPKRPISRRIFSFCLAYIEALIAHTDALLDRILSGDISDDVLLRLDESLVIDTFAWQDIFGCIPVVFHKGKTIPLRIIPKTVLLKSMRLKDGRVLRIPQPHALNQILVALYTGIRHNHLQWLDAETFDQFVEEEKGHEFTKLYVNTDKVKMQPWVAHVNVRVIEILRKQLQWRTLIDEPGFAQKVYYNNNPKTKWGKFYPLFSANRNGSPHNDSRYETAWKEILSGVETMLPEIGVSNIRLCRLLPGCVKYDDIEGTEKHRCELIEYGRTIQKKCVLEIKSDITPHSARVSVVSHLIAVLPADVIGRYVTGQTAATVYHYVKLDDDEVFAEQQLQKLSLRQKGYDEGYVAMISANKSDSARYIKADRVNSQLAQNLRSNLEETFASYGFMTVGLNDNIKTGLDILRETRGEGAVENKTEICPYGNHCPPDIRKQLGGIRPCALCPYAVRHIDHLQAVSAKGRQMQEMLDEVELRLDVEDLEENFTPNEIEVLEAERDRLGQEVALWQAAEEVLEVTRQRIESGASDKKWVVQRPEIIERHLKRVPFPSKSNEYLLARLSECVAYPTLESPRFRANIDLARRHILANTGNIREAFNPKVPANPAGEFLGLIRTVMAANNLTQQDILEMLDTDKHLDAIPYQAPLLLTEEE